jgi:hypothetical protein
VKRPSGATLPRLERARFPDGNVFDLAPKEKADTRKEVYAEIAAAAVGTGTAI